MLKACLVRPCESYKRNEIVMQSGSEWCGQYGLASRDVPWYGRQIQPLRRKLLAPGWWNLYTEAAGSLETGIYGFRTRKTVVLSSFCHRIEGCLLQWVLYPLACVRACMCVCVTSHVKSEVHTTMTIKIMSSVCDIVLFCREAPTFQNNILPPSSGFGSLLMLGRNQQSLRRLCAGLDPPVGVFSLTFIKTVN